MVDVVFECSEDMLTSLSSGGCGIVILVVEGKSNVWLQIDARL